ncbi:alpha/beta fold hydrolase [Planctobacterium marinum]
MTEIEVALPHMTFRGLSFGDPELPPAIALHGWLDNAASFIPLAECLPDFHIIALDLAGHGKTDHRAQGAHYHLMDNVQDLHQVIELMELDKVSFISHSMGGIVSSVYASCFPEKVQALAVIESFGPLTLEPETSPQQLRESIESRIASQQKTPRHPGSMDAAVTARLMAGKMQRGSAQLLMERNIEQSDEGLKWRTDQRLRTISSLRLTEPQANAFIAGVQCPWLTILGSEGFEKLKVNVERRQSLVNNLEVVTCDGGHHLHMDNPGQVAEKISVFFGKYV